MNYIKTISADETVFEGSSNSLLREVRNKGHHVTATRFHFIGTKITGVFTINDEPRPCQDAS